MKKIVHVDNSAFFRKLMKIFLSEQGYTMESYDKGGDALTEIHSNNVSMIITGLSLADMEGVELIKKIITSPQSIPVIALTSNESEPQIEKLKALGVKASILKSGSWREKLLPFLSEYGLG
jgi:CheY-like chemotaxis protein